MEVLLVEDKSGCVFRLVFHYIIASHLFSYWFKTRLESRQSKKLNESYLCYSEIRYVLSDCVLYSTPHKKQDTI